MISCKFKEFVKKSSTAYITYLDLYDDLVK